MARFAVLIDLGVPSAMKPPVAVKECPPATSPPKKTTPLPAAGPADPPDHVSARGHEPGRAEGILQAIKHKTQAALWRSLPSARA